MLARVSPFELRLEVQPVPLCPEIRLRLLSPSVDLDADARGVLGEHAPFWAFCWAAGAVLARHVLDRPDLVRGRSVVDFGCGSGVVAIAAALAGAKSVLACDCDPLALEAARVNAARNGVALDCATAPEPRAVLLASDVAYERQTVRALLGAADRADLALIADPLRRPQALPLERLELLEERPARTLPEIAETTPGAAVYRVRLSSTRHE